MAVRGRDDRALARLLLAGDERTFASFFEGHFPRLYRFALARLAGDEEAAGEVVQATFCRVLDKLHTYRGEAPMFTWMCSICRHQIADHHRRRRSLPVELIEDSPGVRRALEALAAGGEDPEAGLGRREVERLVHATLDHLPPAYGQALELRYLEGLAVPEVAARLALGYKAAESLLSRAREAFRRGFGAVADGALPAPGAAGGPP
jgi:RNA polymerase sigma-70 factor, ECF subfamily